MTGRRRAFWIFLLSGLVAFALAMSYRWFERGGVFNLDTVRIQGIRQADSTAVCEVVRSFFGTSIWRIDPDQLASALEEVPGIDEASVIRQPMKCIVLRIHLAQPVFAMSDSTGTTAISSRGEPLPATFLSDSIPLVRSEIPVDSTVSAEFASWFGQQGMQWSRFSFSLAAGGLTVETLEGREILLGFEDLAGRWKDYQLLQTSISDLDDWQIVDMRYSGQAVLRERLPDDPGTGEES